MYKIGCLSLLFWSCLCLGHLTAQRIDPTQVVIVRDSFGIPHVFGHTDAEAAYGLAWAHSEDDFEHIQHNLLAAKGMLGRAIGKEGLLFDFALQAFEIDATVQAKYESDLSPAYRTVVDGYVQGINDYAAQHPEEVLLRKAFPVTSRDLIAGYVLTTSLMAGLGMALKSVRDDRIEEFYFANDGGSNAFAIAPTHMTDGKTYLLSNSHQPNEGRFAWYEAHVHSDQGWDIVGGLFPGGMCIFTGTNRNLGWAHTTNYHNFGDIYALQINPRNRHQYAFGTSWRTMREKRVRLVVKLAGLPIAVKKKALWTEYGPALKTKQGVYAFRFPGYMDIRSGEQWYRMNKASNLAEFNEALRMQALPLFNVVYGDREGNILLHSGGMIPLRDPGLDWRQPIRVADTLYAWKELQPFSAIPNVTNPSCGYVYNANNTPLHATGDSCNWRGSFPGLQRFEYNRGEVIGQWFKAHQGPFSERGLDSIKFENVYADSGTYMKHFRVMYELDAGKFPQLSEAIAKIKRWDGHGDVDNLDAALVMLAHDALRLKFDCPFAMLMLREEMIQEKDAVWALEQACRFLRRYHGGLDVPLGQVQRLRRGEISLPADGLREVPRAADAKRDKHHRGEYVVTGGDCFIQVSRFSHDTVEVRNVSAFGSSAHPTSSHYTDQMELFTQHGYKPFDWDIRRLPIWAGRRYHPGEARR